MANFSVTTFPNTTGFSTSGARAWVTENNYVHPISASTDYGIIVNNTVPATNGFLVAEYRDFNYQSSNNNALVLKFTGINAFLYCSIDSGNGLPYINQSVTFGRGRYSAAPTGTKIVLRNALGIEIPDAPSTNIIPSDGKVRVDVSNSNQYTIKIYNTANTFICSGTYIDTDSTSAVNGKVGFYHNNALDTGFGDGTLTTGGWKSLAWTDVGYEPIIGSFTSNKAYAEVGQVATFSWAIDPGVGGATAKFNGAAVAMSGTSAVTINGTSAYTLSAYNTYWATSAGTSVTVYANVPVINYLSATTSAISLGASETLNFQTNKATSAYYSDGTTSYYVPIATSGVYTGSIVVTPSANSVYVLSAVTVPGQAIVTKSYGVSVYATPVINSFSNNGPVCSGTAAILSCDISNATSAFFDNGIGWITPVSSSTISIPSVSANTWYSVSAYNPLGYTANGTTQVLVSQNAPVIDATVTCGSVIVTSGITVSAYNTYGSTFLVDASKTFDADNHTIHYTYMIDGPTVGSDRTYTSTLSTYSYTTNVLGNYNIKVSATDPCGLGSIKDITSFALSAYIPPVPVIYGGSNITTSGVYALSGSSSYDPDGNTPLGFKWFQGLNPSVISTSSDIYPVISAYGTYDYYFVVTDSMGLSAKSSTVRIDYSPEDDLYLKVVPGADRNYCLSAGQSTPSIILDGSGSSYYFGNDHPMTYVWDIFSLSAESWYTTGTITGISATLPPLAIIADRSVKLTITAIDPDINGGSYTRSAIMKINTNSTPIVSAGYIYSGIYYTTAIDIPINCPNTSAAITLSATCSNYNTSTATFDWYRRSVTNGQYTLIGSGNPLSASVVPLKNSAGTTVNTLYRCRVTKNNTQCYSTSNSFWMGTRYLADSLKINSFDLNTYQVDVLPGYGGTVTATWSVSGATSLYIDVNGLATSLSAINTGSVSVAIYENSQVTLSAVNGSCVKTDVKYVTVTEDFSVSKVHPDMVKTLAPVVIRYGTDRNINLVDYIPDYIQGRSPDLVELNKFYEGFLNSMFETTGDNGNDNSILPVSYPYSVTNEYALSGNVLSAAPYTYTVGL